MPEAHHLNHEALEALGRTFVAALGAMFAPVCEVVLHDLRCTGGNILMIENPLSGRQIGDATTELGMMRMRDPKVPDIIQNYQTAFPDGRVTKSTSIGLRDSSGKFAFAVCLNLDISNLSMSVRILAALTAVAPDAQIGESLARRSAKDVAAALTDFSAALGKQPEQLNTRQRRSAVDFLVEQGLLSLKGAVASAADTLNVSRATIYNILRARDMVATHE